MKKVPVSLSGNLMDKEWLCTNGLGGYASSSIAGANTRRYHGLLVASFNPPGERRVMVSRVEENVICNKKKYELGCSQYADNTINPTGYQYLESFENSTGVTFLYASDNWKLKKYVFMPDNINATIIEYTNESKEDISLDVNPFLVYRDYHQLQHFKSDYDFYHEFITEKRIRVFPHYQSPPLFVEFTSGVFKPEQLWYKNHFYKNESERGFDATEDTFRLGNISVGLKPGEKCYFVFTTDETCLAASAEKLAKMSKRKIISQTENDLRAIFLEELMESANKFIVKRDTTGGLTLLAGYHWFLDWGRDTLISLRGMGIATGKKELCKSILQTFIKYLDKGMLPNRFPDEGEEPEYNSVDASLWLFVVMYEYYQKFDDKEFIKENFSALTSIIKHYSEGTRYSIHLTPEGFIYAGEGNVQLTWMDARVNEKPITPRHGCPVEINALWYNALNIYQVFKNKLGTRGVTVKTQINKFEKNFSKYFYNKKGYLNDYVIPGEYADESIRPNQIYALSLPFNLLDDSQKHSVFTIVKEHLYTPYGLRSLSPLHKDFIAVYSGSPEKRDASYHQGTVWTFLIGEYYTAELLLNNYSAQVKKDIINQLQPLREHFYNRGGIHCVAEIFDGLEPSEGKGTMHQAWSVAALIDVLIKMQ